MVRDPENIQNKTNNIVHTDLIFIQITFTVYYVCTFMLVGSVQYTSCSQPFCVTFYFKLFRNSHVAMDCEAHLCGRGTKLGKLLFTMNMLSLSHDLNCTD